MTVSQRARTLTRPASQDEQDVAENWRAKAACRTEDPELFFDEHTAQARKVCNTRCPVREICLKDAIDQRDFEGVRGGYTGRQRWFLSHGEDPLSPAVTSSNVKRISKGALTRASVLELAKAGHGSLYIANELRIARNTARHHIRVLRDTGELA